MTIQRMSLLCLAILVLSSSLAVLGEDQAALKDRLRQAEVRSSLNTAGMSPWHLALSYSLLGPKGASSEEGTIEEWWASPTLYKIVFSTPSFTWTEIKNADGFYLSSGKERPDYILRLLLKQVVHPMPDDKQIDDAMPVIEAKMLGSIPSDCIMLSRQRKGFNAVAFGLYPTFCLDHDKNTLRLSSDSGTQIINRTVMGIFAGKSVPINQSISRNDVVVAKAQITKLQAMQMVETLFLPSADMVKVNDRPEKRDEAVTKLEVISKVPPIYPESARFRHVSGTVTLNAIIGTDGHISSLTLLSTPDSDLAVAAIAAVRQWTFKPYLLNGEPTSVDTTVTINFRR